MVLSIAVLKNEINNFIIANGANAISGNIMNSILGDLIDSVVAATVTTTSGSSAPNNANGNEGDLYFQAGVGIYRKTSGSWFLGFSVTGNIVNQNNSPQTANYWITGRGKAADMSVSNAPVNPTDAVRLTDLSVFMPLTGGTFTGDVQQNTSPVNATSLINRGYVDNLISGLQFIGKACVAASTANVVIATAPASLDGVTGVSGTSRWLLKNQAAPAENGVYLFNGTGNALTRTSDASTGSQIANKTIPVSQGTTQADTWWTITNDTITIGTTSITIVQTAGSGTYTNGTGINLSGNIFSLNTTYTNGLYAPAFTGTGYSKYNTGTLAYVTTIPNADLVNSAVTIQGASVALGGSINVINGSGFVKAAGTTISYDNSVYITSASITWPGTIYTNPTNGSISGTTLTFSPALVSQSANTFLAGPTSAGPSVPTWRSITASDIPTLNQNTTGSSGSVVNAITFNSGGAGTTSGSTFNGNAVLTVSYNTLGAQQALTLTTTGTSGAASLVSGVLNIPQYSGGGGGATYFNGAGLSLTGTTFSVNTTQNISSLSNLTANGPIVTSGSTGALSIAATTGTGNVVFSNSPVLVTPTLGVATVTTINKLTLTTPATGSTLTIVDGKTFTSSNTLTLSGTDGSTLNIGSGGTLGTNAYNSTAYVLQTTTVAGFALSGNISLAALTATNTTLTFSATYNGAAVSTIGLNLNNANTWTAVQTFGNNISIGGVTVTGATGTGNNVFSISPALTTPNIGVATATTINGNTWTTGTGTLTLGAGKTFTSSNTLTLSGTDGTVMTFPTTTATLARVDAANTFIGHQTIEGVTSTGATGTGNFVFSVSPALTGSPTAPTATIADNSTKIANTAFVTAALNAANTVFGGAFTGLGTTGSPIALLSPIAVQTGAYSANPGDYIPVSTALGNVIITLPTAPLDQTYIGIKMVIQGSTNQITVTAGGTDVFNVAGGVASATLKLLNQGVLLQYKLSTGIWYVLSNDLSLAQLDLRYAPVFTGTGYSKYSSGTLAYVTAIPNADLVNSTISGVALGSTLAALTATDATLTFSGSYTGTTARTIGLNLSNANTWIGVQTLPTPVFTGLPTGSGVASTATASTLMSRDANANTAINNLMQGYTTTVTAAGTTTLTVASTYLQYFTGTTTQTLVLPVASTLILGTQYQINNQSTGNVTIQSSGANSIIVLAGGNSVNVTCVLTSGTTAASWQVNVLGNSTITGTGSTVFSVTPTFTGTVNAANITLTGIFTAGGLGSNSSFSTVGSGTLYGQTNSSAYQYAGSTNVQYRTGFYGNTLTNLITANASFANVVFAATGAQTNTSGTSAMLANVVFNAPAFILGAGSTTTNAYNIYINGNASTSGTGTLTNTVGALWINGNTRMDLGSDATGDIHYRTSNGQLSRLAIGTSSQVLFGGTIPSYGALLSKPHTIFTPTTGGTVALVANQYNIVNPAGTLAALTVTLPSSPSNNDCVFIKYTQSITTVTYSGGTVVDGTTAPTVGSLLVLVYDAGTTSWY